MMGEENSSTMPMVAYIDGREAPVEAVEIMPEITAAEAEEMDAAIVSLAEMWESTMKVACKRIVAWYREEAR